MMKWINPACGGFDPCLLAGGALASIEKLNACGISGFFDVPSLTKAGFYKYNNGTGNYIAL